MAVHSELPRVAYTVPEAAQALRVSKSKLYYEVAAGRLVVTKIGERSIVLAKDFDAYVASLARSDGPKRSSEVAA